MMDLSQPTTKRWDEEQHEIVVNDRTIGDIRRNVRYSGLCSVVAHLWSIKPIATLLACATHDQFKVQTI